MTDNPLTRLHDAGRTRENLDALKAEGAAIIPLLREALAGSDPVARGVAALALADLGVPDGSELVVQALNDFDYSLIPGPAYRLFEQIIWRVADLLQAGERVDVVGGLVRALTVSQPRVDAWIDVRQDAIRTLAEVPPPVDDGVIELLFQIVREDNANLIGVFAVGTIEDLAPERSAEAVEVYRRQPDADMRLLGIDPKSD